MKPLKALGIGRGPSVEGDQPESQTATTICAALAQWADVANVSSPRAGDGALGILKSDLLNRLIYGGESGPSQTPCPVHEGRWSGMHWGWPGSMWVGVDAKTGERTERPADVDSGLQGWWDAGCRCATHRGSACTTGWNPDSHCCLKEGGS